MKERKLASIRRIDAIEPIPNADAIEVAVVGGWKVVIRKGEFSVNNLAVYCEIDSWIPHELAPFLTKGKEPREFNGVKGERLRTIRLRGQLSQGLLLPLDALGSFTEEFVTEGGEFISSDVTELLGIQKWEAPVSAQLAGDVKGNFPAQIPKTDQERVQNLSAEIAAAAKEGQLFEVTEKLEGSSMTCYLIDSEFGVCSRNLDLKQTDTNTFWTTAVAENVEYQMRKFYPTWNFAIQGELIGPGIQGNIYKLDKPRFYVYDIYDINRGEYLRPYECQSACIAMGLNHVPVIAVSKDLSIGTVDELLLWAEGPSKLNPAQEREGIVFKSESSSFSFKAISNKYLMGEK